MRLTAYKKCLDQAWELPTLIPEYLMYFSREYNPRLTAVGHILNIARGDDKLFESEFVELYQYSQKLGEVDASSSETSKSSEESST